MLTEKEKNRERLLFEAKVSKQSVDWWSSEMDEAFKRLDLLEKDKYCSGEEYQKSLNQLQNLINRGRIEFNVIRRLKSLSKKC